MEDDNFCISCGEKLRLYKNSENLHNINVKSNHNYGNEISKEDMSYNYSRKPAENSEIQLASLGSRIGA